MAGCPLLAGGALVAEGEVGLSKTYLSGTCEFETCGGGALDAVTSSRAATPEAWEGAAVGSSGCGCAGATVDAVTVPETAMPSETEAAEADCCG